MRVEAYAGGGAGCQDYCQSARPSLADIRVQRGELGRCPNPFQGSMAGPHSRDPFAE